MPWWGWLLIGIATGGLGMLAYVWYWVLKNVRIWG